MDIMSFAIVLFLNCPHFALRLLLRAIPSILGEILWSLLLFFGLCFARLVGFFFFAAFVGPVWLIERWAYANPTPLANNDIHTSSSVPVQASKSNGGNQAGKNGIPSDWVTIQLCTTDEISEFNLDEDTIRTQDGVQSGENGEERVLLRTTKQEIERKVRGWLETIDA